MRLPSSYPHLNLILPSSYPHHNLIVPSSPLPHPALLQRGGANTSPHTAEARADRTTRSARVAEHAGAGEHAGAYQRPARELEREGWDARVRQMRSTARGPSTEAQVRGYRGGWWGMRGNAGECGGMRGDAGVKAHPWVQGPLARASLRLRNTAPSPCRIATAHLVVGGEAAPRAASRAAQGGGKGCRTAGGQGTLGHPAMPRSPVCPPAVPSHPSVGAGYMPTRSLTKWTQIGMG